MIFDWVHNQRDRSKRRFCSTGFTTRVCPLMLALLASVVAIGPVESAKGQSAEQDLTALSAAQGQWTSFRNAGTSGLLDGSSLPTNWSPEKGISWQTELPGYGQSSPIVMGSQIFLTAVYGPQKEQNLVVCLDRNSGEQLWQATRKSSMPKPSNYMASRAAPTPVVDGNGVYAFFESGDLFAVDPKDGAVKWEVDCKLHVGEIKSNHGLGSSLAQSEGLIFINLEHDGPSALLAVNKSDGKLKWKTERPSGSSWSSPVVIERGGIEQVILSSAGEVVAFNASSGEQIWKFDGLAGNSVPSPHPAGNQIFLGARMPEFGSAELAAKSNLCLAFTDDSDVPTIKWRSQRCVADYASPVACGEFLYLINGSGVLGCLDRKTGKELYRHRLGFDCWATPIVAGDYLYLFGKDGATTVLHAGETFEVVSENRLWDSTNPPQPVSYREYHPDRKGHSDEASENKGDSSGNHSSSKSDDAVENSQPGARMLAGLLKNDQDGDGQLSRSEMPQRLIAVLENIDLDRDGKLNREELAAMAKSFAERRQGSQASSRDPIVYAVAADNHGFLIRTGTRLYSVTGQVKKQ